MSVVTASQVKKIGFISLVVCFDLLDPKSSLSARQLKKGALFVTPPQQQQHTQFWRRGPAWCFIRSGLWIPLVMDPSRNDGSDLQLWFCEHYFDGFDPQLLF